VERRKPDCFFARFRNFAGLIAMTDLNQEDANAKHKASPQTRIVIPALTFVRVNSSGNPVQGESPEVLVLHFDIYNFRSSLSVDEGRGVRLAVNCCDFSSSPSMGEE
jgi:hypothetical protein